MFCFDRYNRDGTKIGSSSSRGGRSGGSSSGVSQRSGKGGVSKGKVDLSGKWKRGKKVNYENILYAQGIPFLQVKVLFLYI